MPPEKDIDATAGPWAYLAARLRFYRNRAGLKQGELGSLVHSSGSFVSAVETLERRPSAEFIRACDRVLDAAGDLVEIFAMALATVTVPPWIVGFLEAEQKAARIRTYEPQLIPGLLQTESYARASFAQLMLPQPKIDDRTDRRLSRQGILNRETPPGYWAVIDEAALLRLMASPTVAREQLQHILSMREQPHVMVEILPMACGLHPVMDGPFVLLDIPNRGVVGYIDTLGGGVLVTEEDRVAEMERRYDLVRAETLAASRSAQLMRDLLESI